MKRSLVWPGLDMEDLWEDSKAGFKRSKNAAFSLDDLMKRSYELDHLMKRSYDLDDLMKRSYELDDLMKRYPDEKETSVYL